MQTFPFFFLKLVDPKSCFEANAQASFRKGLHTPHKTTTGEFTLAGITGKPTAMPRGINKLWQSSIPAQCFGAHALFMLPAGSRRPWEGLCTASNPAWGEGRQHRAGMQHDSTAGSQVSHPVTQPKPRQIPATKVPFSPCHDTLAFLHNHQRVQECSRTGQQQCIHFTEEKIQLLSSLGERLFWFLWPHHAVCPFSREFRADHGDGTSILARNRLQQDTAQPPQCPIHHPCPPSSRQRSAWGCLKASCMGILTNDMKQKAPFLNSPPQPHPIRIVSCLRLLLLQTLD